MMIIGGDYHPSFQQIAFCMQETGERGERRLNHSDGEAERFYRNLQLRGIQVRVGIEATGAGSRGCWQTWAWSRGSVMRPRSIPSECGSRRPTARMPDFC
jgi:hypothetical protein